MDNSNSSSSGVADQNQPVTQQPQDPQNTPAPVEPVEPVAPVVQAPVQPSVVGGMNKEAGPAVSTHEVMTPSGEHVEPQLSPEVQEAGVEVKKDVPDLTLHDQKAGIQLAKESTPHPTSPAGTVQLPYTEAEAEEIVKKEKDPRKAKYWIAVEVLRQLHKKITNP